MARWWARAKGSAWGAAWFGAFEVSYSLLKVAMPVPAKPEEKTVSLDMFVIFVESLGDHFRGWKPGERAHGCYRWSAEHCPCV